MPVNFSSAICNLLRRPRLVPFAVLEMRHAQRRIAGQQLARAHRPPAHGAQRVQHVVRLAGRRGEAFHQRLDMRRPQRVGAQVAPCCANDTKRAPILLLRCVAELARQCRPGGFVGVDQCVDGVGRHRAHDALRLPDRVPEFRGADRSAAECAGRLIGAPPGLIVENTRRPRETTRCTPLAA